MSVYLGESKPGEEKTVRFRLHTKHKLPPKLVKVEMPGDMKAEWALVEIGDDQLWLEARIYGGAEESGTLQNIRLVRVILRSGAGSVFVTRLFLIG
jgi:hypothetical protein